MALLFMIIRFSPGFASYIFIIGASDVVFSIFDILGGFIYLGGYHITSPYIILQILVSIG